MSKKIKILTVCNQGNCRSVGTRYLLNRRGYTNVIAIGCANTSIKTLKMLYTWADKVLLAKPRHAGYFPMKTREKMDEQFTIGEDLWGNPFNPELHGIVNKQLDLIGLK